MTNKKPTNYTIFIIVLVILGSFFGTAIMGREYIKKVYLEQSKDTVTEKAEPHVKEATNEKLSTTEDVAECSRYVLMIECGDSIGSGVLVNAKGEIITNYHVIDEMGNCYGYFQKADGSKGEPIDLSLIAFDKEKDLALLTLQEKKSKAKYIRLGKTDGLKVGQQVIAIGSPSGLINTVTNGIISAIRIEDDITYIQFSAAASPGNSGGALLNSKGELIGIPSMKLVKAENINFAIGVDEIKDFLNDIRNHKTGDGVVFQQDCEEDTFDAKGSIIEEDLISFSSEGYFGFMDTNGNVVIPAKFDFVGTFVDGICDVIIGDKCGAIDKSGNYIITPKYDAMTSFFGGLAGVRLAPNRWGYIDKHEKFIIDPIYLAGTPFEFDNNTLAIVCDQEHNWFYIDKQGNYVRPSQPLSARDYGLQ